MRFPKVLVLAPVIVVWVTTGYTEPSNLDGDDIERWIQLDAETFIYEEVIENDHGWRGRDGNREPYTPEELAAERRGLSQSPYFDYHRLAKSDPALRVEWNEEAHKLSVYEQPDRLLCWFFLDGKGNPISSVNIFDGREVRHNYGPLVDVGDANFPKWGAAADAGHGGSGLCLRGIGTPTNPREVVPASGSRISPSCFPG